MYSEPRCGAGISEDAIEGEYTPEFVRDNGKAGDQLCSLWDCNGVLAIDTNGGTIWDTADRETWAEALSECGLSE
jgi:hypothetical protein